MLSMNAIRSFAVRQLRNSYALQTSSIPRRTYSESAVPENDIENQSSKPLETSDVEEYGYSVSKEDFKWVERLFPPSKIPQPPKHDSYPTPSGWVAPAETPPNKPYFIRRTRIHTLPVSEIQKPKKSDRWLTVIRYIEGDITTLEKELIELVRPHIPFDPATRVNELSQTIWINGTHKDLIERYLYDLGF